MNGRNHGAGNKAFKYYCCNQNVRASRSTDREISPSHVLKLLLKPHIILNKKVKFMKLFLHTRGSKNEVIKKDRGFTVNGLRDIILQQLSNLLFMKCNINGNLDEAVNSI